MTTALEATDPVTGEPAAPQLLVVLDPGQSAHPGHPAELGQHASEVEHDDRRPSHATTVT